MASGCIGQCSTGSRSFPSPSAGPEEVVKNLVTVRPMGGPAAPRHVRGAAGAADSEAVGIVHGPYFTAASTGASK